MGDRRKESYSTSGEFTVEPFYHVKIESDPRMSNVSPMKSKTIDINESCTSNWLSSSACMRPERSQWNWSEWILHELNGWRQIETGNRLNLMVMHETRFRRIPYPSSICVCVWACGLQAEGLVAHQRSCCKFDNIITEWMDWGAG